MTTAKPKPWHQVVRLKDELRSGELTLAEFAANLHEVTLGEGRRPIYEEPARFFELTFATPALRELVKDVAERLRKSYPFHPDLGDVFYSRWTQLAGFQRTRGILRTLATALRDAESWDECPVIGPAALLTAPGKDGASDAVADLASISTSEKSEGSRTD